MNLKKSYKDEIVYMVLFFATFILSFLVMRNVPLLGDDYYYKTFWGENFWNLHKEHYMLANGRAIAHFLVSVFIAIPPVFWQILNSVFLAIIATFSAKQFAFGKWSFVPAMIGLGMILSLRGVVINQSIYWLTGSFNYVYPFAILALYWYLLCKSKRTWFLYILAFLSGATTEQNGMMTLGITVLYLLNAKFLKKEKLSPSRVCLLIPALIGFCSVYFAPATFVRYGLETEQGILEVMAEQLPRLLYSFILEEYMFPFISLAFVAMGIFIFKNIPKLRVVSIVNILAIFVTYYLSKIPYDAAQKKVLLGLLLVIFIFAVNVIAVFINLIKNKPNGYFVICTAFILAVGTQFMMCASPVWGPRTMLCGILNLTIFSMGLMALVCEGKKYAVVSAVLSLAFLIMGARTYMNTYIGYKTNFGVVAVNEELIKEYKDGTTQELLQYKMPYPEHCWSMPYNSTYHTYYYKMYYGIPEDVEIVWEEYNVN